MKKIATFFVILVVIGMGWWVKPMLKQHQNVVQAVPELKQLWYDAANKICSKSILEEAGLAIPTDKYVEALSICVDEIIYVGNLYNYWPTTTSICRDFNNQIVTCPRVNGIKPPTTAYSVAIAVANTYVEKGWLKFYAGGDFVNILEGKIETVKVSKGW